MKKLALAIALVTATGSAAVAQNGVAARATPDQQASDAVATMPSGLNDLEKTTFACPKAALNAAAREVATHKSRGTYQFSYFNIVSSSHHAAYEVHFSSNYAAEPVLKFCVVLYCQQGFDPATTTSVEMMGTKGAARTAGAGHAANACAQPSTAARRQGH